MLHPASSAGRAGLTALLAAPRHALVALDYDGTLAPIVARPQDAVPAPGTVEVLTELAKRVGQVALLTGRQADVVVALGGLEQVPGLVVLGQYGVQRWEAGRLTQHPPVPGLTPAGLELSALLATEPGTSLEDKGHSLVVHAREAAKPREALSRLQPEVARIAGRAGLELHSGRLVLELRPPGHDKGRALRSLSDSRSAVLFAGDDLGDLPAFDEVDRLRDSGSAGLLVCSDSDEAPGELRGRADLVVPGPAGVVALLRELITQM